MSEIIPASIGRSFDVAFGKWNDFDARKLEIVRDMIWYIVIVVWECWLKQENISEMGPDFDYIDWKSGVMVEWT